MRAINAADNDVMDCVLDAGAAGDRLDGQVDISLASAQTIANRGL